MVLEDTIQTAIDLLKELNIKDYEISLSSSSGFSTSVRLGKLETSQYNCDNDFGVGVYIGQKKGYASSVDMSKQGLRNAIQAASSIAKYTQEDPFNGLAPKELMAFNIPDMDSYYPWEIDKDTSVDIIKECESIALSQKEIENSDGVALNNFKGTSIYANSNKLIAKRDSSMHSINCSLIAKRGKDLQTCYEYSQAIDANDLKEPKSIGIKTAKLARQKLGSKSIAPQKCPVIFTADLAGGIFSYLISALSGAKQYKKSTFLLDSIDKLVLPESINLLELPFAKKTIGAKAFDNDGVLKKEQFFIKNGRVNSYVLGQYSANQLGLKTTANAGGTNNLIVEANCDYELKEMIKTMDKGLVVTELMGQGVSITTGDYSRGAFGFWVENGEIQYPVSNLTIAGNLKDILLDIVYVAKDVDVRKNTKVGSILVSNMTIAG
jgi:PmbA protein